MFLSQVQILATLCDVHVTERGTFFVHLHGHGNPEDPRQGALANSSDFQAAIEKAKPEVRKRKVKVAVPFFRVVNWHGSLSFQHGTATGFHAGTGNVMATFAGDSEQLSGGSHRNPFYTGDMPEEAREELLRLSREIAEREARVNALKSEWMVDVAKAVSEAIDAKHAEAVPA